MVGHSSENLRLLQLRTVIKLRHIQGIISRQRVEIQDNRLIMSSLKAWLREQHTSIRNYLYPETHTINLHHSPFNINTLFYIRLFACLYLSAIYVWALVDVDTLLTQIIYLTMEGYFLTWLYFVLVLQDYLINGFGKWGRVFPLSSNLKYYVEIVNEAALCMELPITLIFWGFLFHILLDMPDITTQVIILNVNLHAGPIICLTLDLAFNTFQYPRCHFPLVAIYGVLYMILNMIYSLTVQVIYKPIDWVSVMSYVLCVGAFLLSFLMHFIGRSLFENCKRRRIEGRIMDGLIEGGKQNSNENSIEGKQGKNEGKKQDGKEEAMITQQL